MNYKNKEKLFSKLKNHKIDVLVFSTFFDPKILEYCKKEKIKTFMIGYPLRDSHREAIKERRMYKKFTEIITLKDIIKTKKSSKKEIIVSPLKENSKNQKKISKIKNILVTCGGGGRPSSKKFLEKTEKAAKEINKEFPEINFTFIRGNAKKNLNSSNIKTINWSDNFLNKLQKHELIISEAGYHTIIDLISAQKPGIILPGERRIDNQELRSVEFEKKGARVVHISYRKL
ncbi:MAG: glycosyltransferase [Candidatus Paceibacteria bacterium]